ncbi:hypothetical protein ACGFX8_29690 [Streptomyces sp. NPDC048362]|uniref:hypothetical protein n=1 Tax=Streptomyces sp. NPDC048362 TaxID=3365539 RepID=UPI0037198998
MPLVLFDLDGTLVDRQSALDDAVSTLCRAHAFPPDVEQRLVLELAERANPGDFSRLGAAFDLKAPATQLWQEYVDLMSATVACRPKSSKAWPVCARLFGPSVSSPTGPATSSAPNWPGPVWPD